MIWHVEKWDVLGWTKSDTLLVGIHIDIWWKSVGNEHGRLTNVIGNQVRETNTIHFIQA